MLRIYKIKTKEKSFLVEVKEIWEEIIELVSDSDIEFSNFRTTSFQENANGEYVIFLIIRKENNSLTIYSLLSGTEIVLCMMDVRQEIVSGKSQEITPTQLINNLEELKEYYINGYESI